MSWDSAHLIPATQRDRVGNDPVFSPGRNVVEMCSLNAAVARKQSRPFSLF